MCFPVILLFLSPYLVAILLHSAFKITFGTLAAALLLAAVANDVIHSTFPKRVPFRIASLYSISTYVDLVKFCLPFRILFSLLELGIVDTTHPKHV